MSKTIKRTLVVVIAIALIIAALAYLGFAKNKTAFAATAPDENVADSLQTYADKNPDLGFTLVNGTEYKVRAVNKNLTSANIPSEYNGLPVTEVASNAFMSCKFLKSIYIPSTVKRINSNAFNGCKELVRVYGASKVETINSNAFYNCINLKYFCIPKSIKTLGGTVFKNITNDIYVRMEQDDFIGLTGVSATAFNGRAESSQIIYGTDMICEAVNEETPLDGYKLIKIQDSNNEFSRTIEDNTFYCSKYEDGVKVKITSIDQNAFEDYKGTELVIAYDKEFTDYPVNICTSTFSGLENIKVIKIDVQITINDEENEGELSNTIFGNLENLTTVYIPDTIDAIPNYTFSGCSKLTTIQLGSMDKNKLSTNIKSIGTEAFSGCTSLAEISIPNTVEQIGEWVFNDWGTVRSQVIIFKSILPPAQAEGIGAWDNGIGKLITITYEPKEITLRNHNSQEDKIINATYGQKLPNNDKNNNDLTKPEPPNAWKEFIGYFLTEENDGDPYFDKDLNPVKEWGEYEAEKVKELHAVYTDKVVFVALKDCDGTVYGTTTFTHKNGFGDMSINIPEKDGYNFIGFFAGEDEHSTQFFDDKLEPTEEDYEQFNQTVLYAHWTPIRYKITFSSYGITETEIPHVFIDYGTKNIYLNKEDDTPVNSIAAPKRQHYVFFRYVYDENCDGNYDDNDIYFEATEEKGIINATCTKEWYILGNDSLIAVWKAIDYKITYVGFNKELPENAVATVNADQVAGDNAFYTRELEDKVDGSLRVWPVTKITINEFTNAKVYYKATALSLADCYDSETKTYKIWYASQFFGMNDMVFGKFNKIVGDYELMKDLDLTNYPDKNIGNFTGTFNGHLHKITGFSIKIINGLSGGLFASNSGTISNLTVSGKITVDTTGVTAYVGLLCGKNTGRIERCYTENVGTYSIVSDTDNSYIGGLVGLNEGVIYNVANRADLYGKGNIGGIVGENQGETNTSYISVGNNQGKIYATIYSNVSIGGIVGIMRGGRIESCTSAGQITLYNSPNNTGKIISPCVAKIVGTIYKNQTSYGTQFAMCSITQEGLRLVQTYIKTSEEKGKIVEVPNLTT